MVDAPTRESQYVSHLEQSLLPTLDTIRRAITQLQQEIAEYRELIEKLRLIRGRSPQNVLTELGAGVWVDAHVPEISTVTLDVGLDVHVDLPVPKAINVADRRAKVLQKKLINLQERERHLAWQVEQFNGALVEINRPEVAQEVTRAGGLSN